MKVECMKACIRKVAIWYTPKLATKFSFKIPIPSSPSPSISQNRRLLHVNTYRSFVESVNFYLRMNDIGDLFHFRGVPLQHAHDRGQKWLRMIGDDLVYVYREGTMDMSAAATCKKDDQTPALIIVPWNNIIDRN